MNEARKTDRPGEEPIKEKLSRAEQLAALPKEERIEKLKNIADVSSLIMESLDRLKPIAQDDVINQALKAVQDVGMTVQEMIAKHVASIPKPDESEQIMQVSKMLDSIKFNIDDIIQKAAEIQIHSEALDEELKKPEYGGIEAYRLEELAETSEAYRQQWEKANAAARASVEEKKTQKEKPVDDPVETITERPISAREKALEKGALMSIGSHVASFSAKDMRDALTSNVIFKLPNAREYPFDPAGQLDSMTLDTGQSKLENVDTIDTGFLMAVTRMFMLGMNNNEHGLLTFSVPSICRELKIDPRPYSTKRGKEMGELSQEEKKKHLAEKRLQIMLSKIAVTDSWVARAADGGYYRVLAFHDYDPESETMTISAPYIYRQLELNGLAKNRMNLLFYGNIVTEPNKAAVELATRILSGILDRGTTPDYKTYKKKPKKKKETVTRTDKNGNRTTRTIVYDEELDEDERPENPKIVTWSMSFASLIAECPQFKAELDAIKESDKKTKRQAYNSKLKNTFETAFRIILDKSDVKDYYINFDFNPKNPKTHKIQAPTASTLRTKLKITHEGKNKNFSSPLII